MRCARSPLFWAVLAFALSAGVARAQTDVELAPLGGAVLTPDTRTLIVSVTSEGRLIYYDTVTEKESKRIDVDFQPTALAVRGGSLVVGTKGSSIVRVLDLASGKELKEIKLPGEPVRQLACHPTRGAVYATNLSDEVFAIDPVNGTAKKTKARGQLIVVDPVEARCVYTGIQKPIKDVLVMEEGPNKTVKLSLATVGLRAAMLKFEVAGDDLKLVAANENAAINGQGLAISPDNKKVAMAGGGGWRSLTDAKANYAIAVFDAADMKTMLGQIDLGAYPNHLAFHPVLNLGVAMRSGGGAEWVIFNAKSLAKKKSYKAIDCVPPVFLFGAQGTKLIVATCVGSNGATESHLVFLPLELTPEEQELLKKTYK